MDRKINREKLKKLAAIVISCEEEHVPVRGNALVSGDAEEDRRHEDMILEQLEWNPWAWCSVKVTATLGSFQGSDYLGCCSYASEEDFKASGGYYDDMVDAAIEELTKELERAQKTLENVEDDS